MSRRTDSLINHMMGAVYQEVQECMDALESYDAKNFDRDPDKVTIGEAWDDLSISPSEEFLCAEEAITSWVWVFDAYLDAAQDFEVLDSSGREVITEHCKSFKGLPLKDESVGLWLNVLHTTLEELIKEKDYKED